MLWPHVPSTLAPERRTRSSSSLAFSPTLQARPQRPDQAVPPGGMDRERAPYEEPRLARNEEDRALAGEVRGGWIGRDKYSHAHSLNSCLFQVDSVQAFTRQSKGRFARDTAGGF